MTRDRRPADLALLLLAHAWIVAPTVAADPSRMDLVRDGAARGDRLVVEGVDGTTREGILDGVRDERLVLRVFDPGKDRFGLEEIPLDEAASVTRFSEHRSAWWPVLGGIWGAGIGAAVGYLAFHEDPGGSDGLRGGLEGFAAVVLGIFGFAAGAVIGTQLGPRSTTEERLW